MANFIEDPDIARAIDDLKRRWPAVGEAADHPLTEWFVRQKPRGIDWNRIIPIISRITVYCCVFMFLLYLVPQRFFYFTMMIAWCFLWLERGLAKRRVRYKTQRKMRKLRDLLARECDPGQLEQLWLTPITYRDCAGIHMGAMYDELFNRRKWIGRKIIGWLLLLGVILGFNSILMASKGSVPNIITVWCCLGILYLTIHFLFSEPAYILTVGLQQITVAKLKPRACFDEDIINPTISRIIVLLLVALVIGLALMIVPADYWHWIDLFILLASFGTYLWIRPFYKMDFGTVFHRFMESESLEYDMWIDRLMHR